MNTTASHRFSPAALDAATPPTEFSVWRCFAGAGLAWGVVAGSALTLTALHIGHPQVPSVVAALFFGFLGEWTRRDLARRAARRAARPAR